MINKILDKLDSIKTKYKVAAAVIFGTIFLFNPTISELIVASWNRSQVYTPGTDTDMLLNWLIIQLVIWFIAVMGILRYLLKAKAVTTLIGALVIVFIVSWLMLYVPSFIPGGWCERELKIYSCSEIYTGINKVN